MSSSGVGLGCRAFRLPRQGYSLEECQDALAVDAERGRFAIADGAAESPYAALWAQLLVDAFVRQIEPFPQWASWLPSLQERWRAAIAEPPPTFHYAASASSTNGQKTADIPWYLEPGLSQGAFATFLGLMIEDNSWYALAVGDSCLFQVRGGELIRTFPILRAAEFSNAPWLVGSRTSPEEVPHKNGLQQYGECQAGDRIWLMTDALAHWFLTQTEAGRKPWLSLEALTYAGSSDEEAQNAFTLWIEGLRATRQLRNDDVTLVAISQ
jgi:hypothetical protein